MSIKTIVEWRKLLDLKDAAARADQNVVATKKQIEALEKKIPELEETARQAHAAYQKAYDEFPEEGK